MQVEEIESVRSNMANMDLAIEDIDRKEQQEAQALKDKYDKKRERLRAQVSSQNSKILKQVGINFYNRYKGRSYFHLLNATNSRTNVTQFKFKKPKEVTLCEHIHLDSRSGNGKELKKIDHPGHFLISQDLCSFLVTANGKIVRAVLPDGTVQYAYYVSQYQSQYMGEDIRLDDPKLTKNSVMAMPVLIDLGL